MLLIPLILLQLAAAPPPHSVDEVLAAVSRNVRDFQQRLPDFVCNERITSTASESGTLQTMKIVESFFTAVQKPSPLQSNGHPAFIETREITAIDGKAVRKGTAMPKLPLAMFGGFSDLLSMTFSSENLEFHTYKLNKTLDEGRLVVKFATKDHQRKLQSVLNGDSLVAKYTGTAWIDAGSYQVVRLERNFLSLPRDLGRLKNTVEYGSTAIGDREFWLPLIMRSDASDRDPRKTKVFLADYTNCRKFTADTRLVQ